MKTYLVECNLNVTSPDGECSKILVSDPEENKMRASYQLKHFLANTISIQKFLRAHYITLTCSFIVWVVISQNSAMVKEVSHSERKMRRRKAVLSPAFVSFFPSPTERPLICLL